MANKWGNRGNRDFIFLGWKSLWMMTAAMKLKDTCSLERKAMTNPDSILERSCCSSNTLRPMDCSTPAFPVLYQLPELAEIHIHWVSDAIQPSHLLFSPFPPAFNLSQHQGLFQWISSSQQVARVWSFSFNISTSSEYSVLFPLRWTGFFLFAVQGTLKSLLQHRSSKASILQCWAFFTIQLSHLYMTVKKKTIALDLCRQSNFSAF